MGGYPWIPAADRAVGLLGIGPCGVLDPAVWGRFAGLLHQCDLGMNTVPQATVSVRMRRMRVQRGRIGRTRSLFSVRLAIKKTSRDLQV